MTEKTVSLAHYDAMCKAIALCHKVDEVKEIRDKALALEAYARQALNRDAEHKAAEIRIRAERRAGQLLKEMKETGQRDPGGRGKRKIESSGTTQLKDLGISKDQSSKWQQVAEVPEEEFEAKITDPRSMPSTESFIPKPKMPPAVSGRALYIWGRITDMERKGILEVEPHEIAQSMTDAMQEDSSRLLPAIIEWFTKLQSTLEDINAGIERTEKANARKVQRAQ